MAAWVWMAFIPISFYKRVKRSCAAPNGCCFIPKERSLESMRRKDSSDLFCIRFLWKIKSGEREETKTRGSFLESLRKCYGSLGLGQVFLVHSFFFFSYIDRNKQKADDGMKKGKTILFLLLAAFLCINRVTAIPVWAPVQQKVVVIDPGHGGWDPGKVGQTAKEKDVNLEIAKILKLYLETADVEVQLTREEDLALGEKKREDLGARRSLAERADVFISIHQNAFPSSGVSGAQVFYPAKSGESRRLAETMQQYLIQEADSQNTRQAKENNSYYLLKEQEQVAVLVECGFLSNPKEEALLQQEDYQHQLAWAMYLALMAFWAEDEKISYIPANIVV